MKGVALTPMIIILLHFLSQLTIIYGDNSDAKGLLVIAQTVPCQSSSHNIPSSM